jgi:hypothetical protein
MKGNDHMAEDYSTYDLNLAAFLIAQGHALRTIGRQPGGRCVFRFAPGAAAAAPGYLANQPVPAWNFAQALRNLKARVRESF